MTNASFKAAARSAGRSFEETLAALDTTGAEFGEAAKQAFGRRGAC
jgi:hypothetical protein